jgi:hypothetical protein
VVKLKITTLAEEERGMNADGPWEGRGERSQQQRRNDMNNDEEPNNPRWNEKSRAWRRTRGRGGWKAISSHGVPAVLISDKKAICGPDFSFHSGSYCRLFYFSFQ